ncbi:MAG: helix-turn-helix domain-containing protein [Coprobacillus cateniformis]|uniref:AraC family transcriptional regulator n=1 Tax=Longibaculum muris TaxID=1796628 RepID=UPI0029FEE84F|nr:helix-turn-helix domain-containing protein [Coprobacillus cateniformis]
MNYEKLDNILRQHTDSEKRHLQGSINQYHNLTISLDKKSQKIYHFTFSQLLRNDSIMITRNERFAKVPCHIHDYIEINYMYSGQCEEDIDGKKHLIHKGQMTFIDTKTPHAIGMTNEDDIMINFLIKKEYLMNHVLAKCNDKNLMTSFFINTLNESNNLSNYMILNTENNERLQMFIYELLYEYYFPSLNAREMINNLFVLIILEMINSLSTSVNYASITESNTIIINALGYMEKNFFNCSLETTAKHVGVNPCYLTTLLKKHIHQSYKDLIIQLRIEYAAQLILSNQDSIDNIARKSGYQNLTFFYKKFKELYHCSPKEYRQKNNVSF